MLLLNEIYPCIQRTVTSPKILKNAWTQIPDVKYMYYALERMRSSALLASRVSYANLTPQAPIDSYFYRREKGLPVLISKSTAEVE